MIVRSLDVVLLSFLALGAAACSNSPGPTAQGASRVFPTSSNCGSGPYVIPAVGTITTETIAGARIKDGDDADVDCTVKRSGDGYRISMALEEGPAAFSLSGTVTESTTAPGTFAGTLGTVSFYDPDSGNVVSETCDLEIAANQEIGSGKAWGNYSCTNSVKEATPGFSCNFEGSFLVENCN